MRLIILFFILFQTLVLNAQVGIGTTSPNPASILDVESSTKGFLIPRLTASERDNITDPAEGLMLYCTNCCLSGSSITFYNGERWENVPDCTTREDVVAGASQVTANANDFVVVLGSDGNLYSWGDESPSNNKALGIGIDNSTGKPKEPTPFANPGNISFIQSVSAHHGSAIALSVDGYVYGAGLSNKGAGNTGDPNEFTKIQLGGSDTKAILLGSSEGGSIAIGEDDKAYLWGYNSDSYFGAWAGVSPQEVSLPSGVLTSNIISVGGSFHYLSIASETKVYVTGSTAWGTTSPGAWTAHAETFNTISKVRVGRNMIMVEDNDGLHLLNNITTKQTVDISAITDPIIKKTTDGSDNNLYIVTASTIYYKNFPSDMSGATEVDAPVGFEIEDVLVNNINSDWVMVKLKQTSDSSIHYYGFKVGTSAEAHLGDFNASQNVMQDLNLNTAAIPNGVELNW